jgi:DNA invertase Pin-like site-specific DNA recombinase
MLSCFVNCGGVTPNPQSNGDIIMEMKDKVGSEHLKRKAYLYVRQSTIRQVFENTESSRRQYGLRERAVVLGWPQERIEVIDTDLGQTGTSAVDRLGFQKLVAEVGLGRVGIVMGLEVSRLARNCADWHRLIEICGMTRTLILDEDGIYDPTEFNDRLLLGLKGTMSEAETYLIRARLRGGILNKATRGELRTILPVGLAYDGDGRITINPDKQIQQSFRLLYETFFRTGTAHRTAKYFRDNGFLFPRKTSHALDIGGNVIWGPLAVRTVLLVLHNPRYAGAYVFGRRHWKKDPDGRRQWEIPPKQRCRIFIPDTHTGYISWSQFEQIDRTLCENALAYGIDHHHGPPREGPALLQGRVVCGVCGNRMSVHYHRRDEQLVPEYFCNRNKMEHGDPVCQVIPGAGVDAAVGEMLMGAMTPMAIEISLAVEEQVQERFDQAGRLRQQQVERARYEAQNAQRRYMMVDPANSLVADSLEAEWNQKLRALADAWDNYERRSEDDRKTLDVSQNKKLFSLSKNFQEIWKDYRIPQRERKRILALLVEDVTLIKKEKITIQVRFKGGATTTVIVPIPLNAWQGRKTPTHCGTDR